MSKFETTDKQQSGDSLANSPFELQHPLQGTWKMPEINWMAADQSFVNSGIVPPYLQNSEGFIFPASRSSETKFAYRIDTEGATFMHRPTDPDASREAEYHLFKDTGKNIEIGNPSSWTLPTRENYKGWMPGDTINPLTYGDDASEYVAEIMRQNFIVNDKGNRVPLSDDSIDDAVKNRFVNSARHATGIGDLVFNHHLDPKEAKDGMFWHEPPTLIKESVKAIDKKDPFIFTRELSDSFVDLQNNAYASSKASHFHDFASYERQLLNDAWISATNGSRTISGQ